MPPRLTADRNVSNLGRVGPGGPAGKGAEGARRYAGMVAEEAREMAGRREAEVSADCRQTVVSLDDGRNGTLDADSIKEDVGRGARRLLEEPVEMSP